MSPMAAPSVVHLKLTRSCNARCSMCNYYDSSVWTQSWLGIDTARALINEIAAWDGVELVMLSGGEPTLHPDLLAIGELLAEQRLPYGIATNGALPEKVSKLISRGTLVQDSSYSEHLRPFVMSYDSAVTVAHAVPSASLAELRWCVPSCQRSE